MNLAEPTFTLDSGISSHYRNTLAPRIDALGQVVTATKYFRLRLDGYKENIYDCFERVVNGTFSILKNHCTLNDRLWDESKSQRMAAKMLESMLLMKFLPPGRGLWAMGTSHVEKYGGAALNNCGFVSTKDMLSDPVSPFKWMMDMMMVGVGVGFDLKGVRKVGILTPEKTGYVIVDDSREGWIDATERLLHGFFSGFNNPRFDYSKIRLAGVPLKTFGGVSAGPEPLIKLHLKLESLLYARNGKFITSLDILDIMNMIGECVYSGNIRRGAQIALGDANDGNFVTAKSDLDNYPWRRSSNNSVLVDHGTDWGKCIPNTTLNGEPGYFWLENARKYGRMGDVPNYLDHRAAGTNPCGEQTLESYELCCLVETFPAKHDMLADYMSTLKLAYLYAKAVTLVETSWAETNDIIRRNRRIGCSMSGVTRAFRKFGKDVIYEWCDKSYTFLHGLDQQYSAWLDVNTSIKRTSVKPSGTVSLVAGEPPGIHYPHSPYYIRRQRLAHADPMLPILEAAGYRIEDDYYERGNTMVVEFPIRELYTMRDKSSVSMWEQLSNAAMMQHYWADNQVSVTVTFKPEEKDQIEPALEYFSHHLKSVSFLPLDGATYPQMPYEKLCRTEYEAMCDELKPLDMSKLSGEAQGDNYCDTDRCSV